MKIDFRLGRHNNGIKIETTENTKVTKSHKTDIPKMEFNKSDKKGGDNPKKFELYFNFQGYMNSMHSHQTLAINRGENLKVNAISNAFLYFLLISLIGNKHNTDKMEYKYC